MSRTYQPYTSIERTVEAWERSQGTKAAPANTPAVPDDECDRCGAKLAVGDWPYCPHGSFRPEQLAIVDDTMDQWIENMGAEPYHATSRQEWKREVRRRGLRMRDHHAPMPGTDKGKHTQRFV